MVTRYASLLDNKRNQHRHYRLAILVDTKLMIGCIRHAVSRQVERNYPEPVGEIGNYAKVLVRRLRRLVQQQ